jgi:two-component system, cell cycle response regulator
VTTLTETSVTPGPKALRALLGLVLFGLTGLIALHDWAGLGGASLDHLAGGYLYDAVVVAAGIACLLRSRAIDDARAAWIVLGLAILCWAAGEIYWARFIVDNPAPPYPSPADGFYLAFYPIAYAGIALLVRARAHELDWRLWTDGLIAALGTAALGAAFVFDFIADRSSGSELEVATTLAYPLGDIVLLAMVVGVIALTGWRPGRTWLLLLAGLAAQAVADIAYSLQATAGVVPPGNWIDPFYLLSAAFLGALLWQPPTKPIGGPERLSGNRELMVPALFVAFMIGLFAMQHLSDTSPLSTTLWAATMLAVIVRLALSVRQNRVLLEQVRTDSLTGLGNRGAMEVDLKALGPQVDPRKPVAMYLFDLNGFKRYNDTFGHPAGDELLARFGVRLRAAVVEDGCAYRIGGDEFCVVLTCEPELFDQVAKRAAEALTEHDRGVAVSASWGGAAIPSEAGDPSAALQLADVRMYAQKESRRAARVDLDPTTLTRAEPGEQEVESAADLRAH